ncbi:hypothetical protein [Paenibacillus roseipurpureus]|uniref:Uncharacterized protein n=1 Tax=Paenibacillus roseopurpureus TaxID=2918901 RepID=A0AA96LM50_9BACL|nr:hypothetical protein [Paenibacillus sp. MBLB1832]WNR44522.1 hypothetical protein MJB10_26260 [Paenibacillus sp. MBLB1832]
MSEKKGDDEMINKDKTEKAPQVTTVSNDQAIQAAKQQFEAFRETFKKLAKN